MACGLQFANPFSKMMVLKFACTSESPVKLVKKKVVGPTHLYGIRISKGGVWKSAIHKVHKWYVNHTLKNTAGCS